jgi:ATP/maltotriose-dependent transcriptional regulator MalT
MEKWVNLWDGWRELRAYPIYDSNRNVVYAVKIGFDITERKLNLDKQKRYLDDLENSLEEMTKKKTSVLFECPNGEIHFNLTGREIEVLDLIAQGFTNTEISKIISISPHTVKSHVIHIFNKLGVNDRTQASVLAARLKLI